MSFFKKFTVFYFSLLLNLWAKPHSNPYSTQLKTITGDLAKFTLQKARLSQYLASFATMNKFFQMRLRSSTKVKIPLKTFFSHRKKYIKLLFFVNNARQQQETIVFQKHLLSGRDFFVINNVLCSCFDNKTIDLINNQLNETLRFPKNLNLFFDKTSHSLVFDFSEKRVSLTIKPSSLDKEYEIFLKKSIAELQKKIKQIKKEHLKQEQTLLNKNSKWETPFLKAPPPESFLKNIKNEIEEARSSNFESVRLASYLQILTTLKCSGYVFRERSLENNLVNLILNALSKKLSRKELYELLCQYDGISRVLIKNNKILSFPEPLKLKKLRQFFIVKNNSYYIRQNQFSSLEQFLRQSLKQYKKTLESQKTTNNSFVEELTRLKRSSISLEHNSDYPQFLREQYKKIKELCTLFERDKKTQSPRSPETFFHFWKKQNFSQKKTFVIFSIIFQNLLFSDSQLKKRLLQKRTLLRNNFWRDTIQNIFETFPRNIFSVIGSPQKEKFFFTKISHFLSMKMFYTDRVSFPSKITIDKQGHFLLKLRKDIFASLEKHTKLNTPGAKLWAKAFLSMALLRSLGIEEENLSVLMTLFLKKSFSSSDYKKMLFYFENILEKRYFFEKFELLKFFYKKSKTDFETLQKQEFNNDQIFLRILEIFALHHHFGERKTLSLSSRKDTVSPLSLEFIAKNSPLGTKKESLYAVDL